MATFGFIGTGNMGGALPGRPASGCPAERSCWRTARHQSGGPGPGAGLPGCGQCGGGRWGRLHLPGREALYGGRADGEDRPRAGGAEGPVRAGVHGGGPHHPLTCGAGPRGLAPDPHHAQYPSAIGGGRDLLHLRRRHGGGGSGVPGEHGRRRAAAAPGRPSDGRRRRRGRLRTGLCGPSSSRPWRTAAWPAASPVPWRWSAPPRR